MVKNRLLYILALMGSAVFYVAYEEWISWIILAAMLMLPWLSLTLSLPAILRMRIKLDVPERIIQGTEARLIANARCTAGYPPYKYKIKAKRPITGEEWSVSPDECLPSEHCGGLTVNTARTQVYDYLGLFKFRIRRAPSAIVRVMPKNEKLPIPDELTDILAHSLRAKRGGGFSESHEIRPYRTGDTLNLIHWKLSAKTDELMLREPMEQDRGLAVLTLDINGTPDELDRKFSRLFNYGRHLLENGAPFEVLALTGNGMETWLIREESDWKTCTDSLLCAPFAALGSVKEHDLKTLWQCHIGGEPYEA